MSRALIVVAVAALTACVTAEPRAPLSLTALLLDAPGYVASRYKRDELPTALIADLTALEFQCQHSAMMSECGRSEHAFGSCFDVITVRIAVDIVAAEGDRRCLGAQP